MNEEAMAERHMRHTLSLAAEALELGELPIAAIVVLDDRIIGSATTAEQREQRLLVHAELAALEQADRLGLSLAERRKARLFTNLEPCLMCLGAAMSFFLGEIHYALESPADGAVDLVRAWSRAEEDYAPVSFSRGHRRAAARGKHQALRAVCAVTGARPDEKLGPDPGAA